MIVREHWLGQLSSNAELWRLTLTLDRNKPNTALGNRALLGFLPFKLQSLFGNFQFLAWLNNAFAIELVPLH